jgi:uncharacterized integral membrane protein
MIDVAVAIPYRARSRKMNAKLLFKIIFLIAIAVLLVLMGMNNRQVVEFNLPPILPKAEQQPAALMYIAFFGLGLLSGAILVAGGPKASGGGRTNRVEK